MTYKYCKIDFFKYIGLALKCLVYNIKEYKNLHNLALGKLQDV